MNSVEIILAEIKKLASSKAIDKQKYFGINTSMSFGLTTPQMRTIAKTIGRNHKLAMQLWKTGHHEAKHIAIFIADPNQVTEKLMEELLKDFSSWDTVDNCCGTLFTKTPFAFDKAIEWTKNKTEFQKRAGFVLMAELAIHNKSAEDKKYEKFFSHIIRGSHDERNFVKKAVNWALRQIGKRNKRLCDKAIIAAKEIYAKGDSSSRWIASDALRELEKYKKEGKIKNLGRK
ncbi:MAG TPA: DNA alkylation repair protein [Bacteroidia bacterium]|nr:DNA alkylation repair protein [Bacteroidia bacterium]